MVNLRRQHAAIKPELHARLQAVIDGAGFIGGADNAAFEAGMAARVGVRHGIGVASGTDALHLALRAAGISPGDEVITSPFTFAATAGAICQAGARPVFADIDPLTFNVRPDAVERALSPRTKALMPVHLFGQPADMHALMALARRHGLAVIEDCAQSFGASLGGTATGAFGDAGAFSFYPTKNLGACGDGGLVVTDSDEMANRIRRLANHGAGAPQEYIELGFNSRLDTLQAAALLVKLRYIDEWNEGRRRVAARYDALLEGLPVQLPRVAQDRVHVFHHYTVLLDERDAVAATLRRQGIATAVHYPECLHRQPAFAGFAPVAPLRVAEDAARRCLSLPIYPELEDEEIEEVAAALCRAVGARPLSRTLSSGSDRAYRDRPDPR
jgi:dTDP-4-amino-4,6-dideoxygalactose transaminase